MMTTTTPTPTAAAAAAALRHCGVTALVLTRIFFFLR